MPAATFATVVEFKRDFAGYLNVSESGIGTLLLVYSNMFEIFKAALATTASLNFDYLRTAFLHLAGNTSYLRPVDFVHLTGVNDGSVTAILQLRQSTGLDVLINTTQLIYPYSWPWSRVQVGDTLEMSQQPPAPSSAGC